MKPTRLTVALVAASSLLLSACGGKAASGSGGSTYKVLVVASQTGPLAALGKPFLTGLEVAADELNAKGGILGRKVSLQVIDSQSDPTKAVSLLQQQLAKGSKPDLVWDGTVSAEALAILPVLSSRKLLSIGSTGSDAINNPAKFPYAFHATPHQGQDAAPANVAAMQRLGCKSVGLLAPGDATGDPVRKAYPAAFSQAGIPLKVEEYAPTDIDMTAPLTRLKSDGVGCVITFAAGATAPYVLNSRAKIGWTAPLMLNESMTADIYKLVGAPARAGVYLHTFAVNAYREPGARTAAYTSFVDGLKAKGPIDKALVNYSWPHDLLRMVALGAQQAGSVDSEKVKKALENLRQPAAADKPYVSYGAMSWSAGDHFVHAAESDYSTIGTLSPLVDGTWK